MSPDAAPTPRVWGVRELLNYLARQLRFDPKIQELGVRGEVTDLSPASGAGHVYFALKEPSGALLKCFVRNTAARALPKIENGVEAIAFGSLGTYEYRSQFQLFVTGVQLVGAGALAAVYERMKRKLEAQGLFDPSRKRPIPRFPFHIALVSSPDAEGANDFLGIVRRVPAVAVSIHRTVVQGPAAPESIARAIGVASRSGADVIVLARGGGSDEDRLPFNEEIVARAIAAAHVPVITAIGHRGDHHIADDVADREVATPTAAAELLVAEFEGVERRLRAATERMRSVVDGRVERHRSRLRLLAHSPYLQRFDRLTDARAERVDRLLELVTARRSVVVHRKTQQLRALEARLGPVDPRARLAERRGRLAALSASLGTAWANDRTHAERDLRDAVRGLAPALSGRLLRATSRAALLAARLAGKDPEAILQQGYAIVRSDGRIVRDAATLRIGAILEAQLSRGTVRARVEETRSDG